MSVILLTLSQMFTKCFIRRNIIPKEKEDIFVYGFQLIISTLSSMMTILLISCFTNIAYGILFLFFFMPIRGCVGGYHADTFEKCFIYTSLCFPATMMVSAIMQHMNLTPVAYILLIFGYIILILKAPCRDVHNPLSAEAIDKNKFYTRILLLIYASIILVTFFRNPAFSLAEANTLNLVTFLFLLKKREKGVCLQ